MAMLSPLDNFVALTLVSLAFITACSSTQTAQQTPVVSGAAPNQATVYFYRLQNSPGAVTGIDLKDNGIDIGTLQDGTYFVYHANPGVHALTATTDTAATQNFTLQPGATYYIKANVARKQETFQPSLSVVFDLQGQAAIQNLKRLSYNE